MLKKSTQDGFTLIELLMVILVIAILAVIAITQFVNYGKDSRDAATRANLQVLRRAISEKNGLIRVRCNVQDSRFPLAASITANNILKPDYDPANPLDVTKSPCQATDVPVTADTLFVATGIPVNPWSTNIHTTPANANLVTDCPGCTRPLAIGDTVCGANTVGDGWCYNSTTGEIWANSSNNDGDPAVNNDNEYLF
jgi:prepilin-type N-terminal cleavage/methylation domain-containing protein